MDYYGKDKDEYLRQTYFYTLSVLLKGCFYARQNIGFVV